MFNVKTIATPAAAAAAAELTVPNKESFTAFLLEAKESQSLVTWVEAHAAAGYEGAFRNTRTANMTAVAKTIMPNGDALIVDAAACYSPKVAAKHIATISKWGYDKRVIGFVIDATQKRAKRVAEKAARKAAEMVSIENL